MPQNVKISLYILPNMILIVLKFILVWKVGVQMYNANSITATMIFFPLPDGVFTLL